MKRRSVQRAYEPIRPDADARERMLQNILHSSEISPAGKDERHMRKRMKPLVVAAIIALMVMLMGCAIVIFGIQDLKIGEHTYKQGDVLDSEGNVLKEKYVTTDVISLQGIQNTPAFLANQEWLQFTQSYVPELDEYWESDPDYWAYNVLNQTMVDKVDEICKKYGLDVIGRPWHEHVDCNQFLPLLGVENLLKPESNAELHIPNGRFFEGGSFTVYGTLTLPKSQNPVDLTYHYVKKNVFYDVFAYVPRGDVIEKNYTTKDNEAILLVQSENSGLIMVDQNNYFITISTTISNETSLEQIADQFDFSVQAESLNINKASEREQESINLASGNGQDRDYLRRPTYREYVNDLLQSGGSNKEYAFYDLDGNGEQELLIIFDGFIGNAVGMNDGKTDEGKSYRMKLYEGNVLIDEMEIGGNTYYHIFRFADDGNPVFSNLKEKSIVRLKKEGGIWWRTSDTSHYAEYDKQITEKEAMDILNQYSAVELDTKPLNRFEE